MAMIFSSQIQAKKFFIDRIIFHAQKGNIPLTEAERYMLGWTEVEQGFEMNQQLTEKFNEETSDAKYEKKISSLVRSAYDADIKSDPELKETYRSAYKVLKQGDHYLLVMINNSIGWKLRWGFF
jgi:hypothetical protein